MEEAKVAVMLADISGSTALYEDVGNIKALHLVSGCLDLIRATVEKHGGDFISSKGDDVLCIFENPEAGLDVGMEVLAEIADGPLSLHAGLDFGPVIRARDDVFGDSVNTAARLDTLANSGEILCSQAFYDKLGLSHRAMLRFFGTREFKGKAAPMNVYLFSDAPPGQATEIIFPDKPEPTGSGTDSARLEDVRAALRYGKETFICTRDATLTIGRADDCDLVVPMPWVSRSHAYLEVRQDKLYLTDRSTSGTYVRFAGQNPFLVQRETIMLTNACTLSPSRHPDDSGAQPITCEVMDPAGAKAT